MRSLVNPSVKYRDELEAATLFGKLLLEYAFQAKLDQPTTASYWYSIFLAQTQIARDYFLDIELDGLEEWDAPSVLEFRHAIQEATRSPKISEWDAQRIKMALNDFNHTWRTAGTEHAAQLSTRVEKSEPPELQQLDERLKRVYHAGQVAAEELTKRMPLEAITKRQVWEWLKDNSPDGYEVPGFETFKRYLRAIPNLFPRQRRGNRRNAVGRSTVSHRNR
jgi:hypothetical protein